VSASPSPRPAIWHWSRRNLSAVAALSLGLLVLVCWRWYRNGAIVNDDLTVSSVPLPPAAERINPNTATWASLARLPGIGPGHAKAIVTYRQSFSATHAGQVAFVSAKDLANVSGMGPKTIEEILPFLEFLPPPGAALTATPATNP
jgi:competence ComEA-like helix-hairpin-helix protein